MSRDEDLAHSLKLQFGLAPTEPNHAQLQLIKKAIAVVIATGKLPTKQDWRKAVAAACPSIETHNYAGVDNSDLNTLLALANQATGGR